jgi:hypothetical protein
MDTRKVIKRIGLGIGGLIGVLVLVLLVLVVFQVPISLDRMRPGVIEAARERLDREVAIDGGVSLVLGLRPALEVRGFRIANPEGWPGGGNVASFDRLRARVALGKFLDGRLDIHELMGEGMELSLEGDGTGGENWYFPAMKGEQRAMGEGEMSIVGFDELSIHDLAIKAHNVTGERDLYLRFDEVKGSAAPKTPLNLDLTGALQGVPFTVSLLGESLEELLALERSWK